MGFIRKGEGALAQQQTQRCEFKRGKMPEAGR